MCCSTCVKGFSCMGWIFSAIVFAVLAAAPFVGVEIFFGGPIPTYNWQLTANLIYAGGFFTIVTSIVAFMIVTQFTETILNLNLIIRWVVFGVANVLLIITVLLVLSALPSIAAPITQADVIKYTMDYKEKHNGEMPPAFPGIERVSRVEIENMPMGCCGLYSFNDYVEKLLPKKCSGTSEETIKFNAPKSCCKVKEFCDNLDTLSNNDYIAYDVQYYIQQRFIKEAMAKNVKSVDGLIKIKNDLAFNFVEWLSGFDAEKKKKDYVAGELPPPDHGIDFAPKVDCPNAVTKYFKGKVGDWDGNNPDEWFSDEKNGKIKEILEGDKHETERTLQDRKRSAENYYLKVVQLDMRTQLMGCAEWLETVFKGDNYFKYVFESNGGLIHAYNGLLALKPTLTALIVILLLHAILNVVWFNYYYVPLVLFRGKCDLPFYPKKNKVLPSKTPSTATKSAPLTAQVSPTEVAAADPEQPAVEPEATEAA